MVYKLIILAVSLYIAFYLIIVASMNNPSGFEPLPTIKAGSRGFFNVLGIIIRIIIIFGLIHFGKKFEMVSDEIFETFVKSDKLRNEIILNSQEVYRESINEAGMEKFCNWFLKQIQ